MRKQLQLVDLDHPTRIGRPLVRDEYHFGQPNMASSVVVRIIYFSLDFNHWKSHSSVVKGKSLASSCNSSLGQLHGRATAVTAASRRRQDLWRTNRAGLACPFFYIFSTTDIYPRKETKPGTHTQEMKEANNDGTHSQLLCMRLQSTLRLSRRAEILFIHAFFYQLFLARENQIKKI